MAVGKTEGRRQRPKADRHLESKREGLNVHVQMSERQKQHQIWDNQTVEKSGLYDSPDTEDESLGWLETKVLVLDT